MIEFICCDSDISLRESGIGLQRNMDVQKKIYLNLNKGRKILNAIKCNIIYIHNNKKAVYLCVLRLHSCLEETKRLSVPTIPSEMEKLTIHL